MAEPALHVGDCLEVMRGMADCSVDAIVTDPPYGLSFMGQRWDYDVPSIEIWAECLRVLKPGGHLLAFAGTRTQHRMAVRIEDAGFEIRDMIAWVYGSGFPKSLDVSKAIDKAAGHARGRNPDFRNGPNTNHETKGQAATVGGYTGNGDLDEGPVTEQARQWDGWGTALKPALEPITLARKPLAGTAASNVLVHGTGALNIEGCRVGADQDVGRWPANLIHDGSEEVLAAFPEAPGQMADASINSQQRKTQNVYGAMRRGRTDEASADSENRGDVGFKMRPGIRRIDAGSAARFFYCAKASKRDRDDGLIHLPLVVADPYGQHRGRRMDGNDTRIDGKPPAMGRNDHPTVKPTDLMRYLCRLVTPPGGLVLDPFMGSGSTGKAAALEGFGFVGIELDPAYVAIARARISAALEGLQLGLGLGDAA